MQITLFTVLSILIIASALQGLFLVLLLWLNPKGNKKANRILALALFVFSINILVPEVLKYTYELFPHLIAIAFPTIFLFGPLGLYYSYFQTGYKNKITGKDYVHGIPAVITYLLLVPFYLSTPSEKIELFKELISEDKSTALLVSWALECIHITIYMFAIFLFLKKYQERLKRHFSNIDKINLQWLKQLGLVQAIICGCYLILFITNLLEFFTYSSILYYGFILSISFLVYFVGYKSFNQPEIFQEYLSLKEITNKKYVKSGLHPGIAEEYFSKLTLYMEEEKAYCENNLTLPELSSRLEMPVNYLSQVINEKMNLNFYNYINFYRIQEAKELLKNDNQSTIIAIAYAVGFNTKSTFNTAFKKFTGITPSEFREKSSLWTPT